MTELLPLLIGIVAGLLLGVGLWAWIEYFESKDFHHHDKKAVDEYRRRLKERNHQ